jgi:hypothetical protein
MAIGQPKEPGGPANEPVPPTHIAINYLKSSLFRVIHVSGAVGGISPSGLLEMNLFSERSPIPRRVVYAITPELTLGEELEREGREGVIREIEMASLMDLATARVLHEWLGKKIELIERLGRGVK